uniref:Uncharacterized protein n=1 Tax=viral metagenome TaxID=1070528 RepID=A0A6C0M090_9ZZZZ
MQTTLKQQQQQQHKRTLRANQRTLRARPTIQPPKQNQNQNQNPNQNPNKMVSHVQDIIKNLHNSGSGSDSESDSDTEVAPMMQKQFQTEPVFNHNMYAAANSADLSARMNPAPAKEGFASNTLANAVPKQYPQYMPSVFQGSSSDSHDDSKGLMLQKLDHIISLLEEQHDEKTDHVTEELILYCFLGVFIIFIVDSFARAGKYVR